MWYWIHNCSINPSTGNFNPRDDSGPVFVWILTESMVVKTFVAPGELTSTTPVFSNFVQTSTQDFNNALYTTGGISTSSIKLTQIPTPSTPVGTGSSSGGTLAAGTYYIRVIAVDINGQSTAPSTESVGITTTGSTSSINYTIYPTPGVSTFRIYPTNSSGVYTGGYFTYSPDYITNTFTLTSLSGTTSGILPTTNTTGTIQFPDGTQQTSAFNQGMSYAISAGTVIF
jgi:hypothetical protein